MPLSRVTLKSFSWRVSPAIFADGREKQFSSMTVCSAIRSFCMHHLVPRVIPWEFFRFGRWGSNGFMVFPSTLSVILSTGITHLGFLPLTHPFGNSRLLWKFQRNTQKREKMAQQRQEKKLVLLLLVCVAFVKWCFMVNKFTLFHFNTHRNPGISQPRRNNTARKQGKNVKKKKHELQKREIYGLFVVGVAEHVYSGK